MQSLAGMCGFGGRDVATMHTVPLLLLVLFLGGCKSSQQNRVDFPSPPATHSWPVPPPPSNPDGATRTDLNAAKTDLRNELAASNNATQNALSGLVNTSVSKVAEQMKLVEANLKDLITVNNNAHLEARVEFKARLEAAVTTTANLRAELNNTLTLQAQMNNTMQTRIGELRAELKAQVDAYGAAQAGFNNRIEQVRQEISNQAGRDVNYLPREAVNLLLGIMTTVFGAITVAIGWLGKNARQREQLRTQLEREERQRVHKLLLEALALVPEHRAKEIMPRIEETQKCPTTP